MEKIENNRIKIDKEMSLDKLDFEQVIIKFLEDIGIKIENTNIVFESVSIESNVYDIKGRISIDLKVI